MPCGCDHAAERVRQRYAVALTEADFEQMVRDIVAALVGDRCCAVLLARVRFGREVWLLQIPENGPAVRVIYTPMRAQIVTILPPDYRLPGDRYEHA